MGSIDFYRELYKACRDEYEAHNLYKTLAKFVKNEKFKQILEKAAKDEFKHYKFLKNFVGDCGVKLSKIKMYIYSILLILFGLTIVLKVIESKEIDASKIYRELSEVKPELKNNLISIIEDEERHESEFTSNIDENRVKYIGSITLGISDALIELTGIYTGSLGAFENTVSAGLTGFLAGVAASISMGIASYSQAKNEGRKNPKLSALYTSTAYLLVVIFLALPYFIASSILTAFIVMIFIATALVAYMTFYTAVLYNKNYLREFIETMLMILGVSLTLYLIGSALSRLLGLENMLS